MKDGSKRMVSRIVAFVMLVSCMLSNIIMTNAGILSDANQDNVVSGSAVDTQYKWSADDLTAENLTADPSLGGEIFSYACVSGKSKVTANNKVFADGSSFAQRLQVGAKSVIADNAGVFTIKAPSAGKLYVYAITGSNNDGRTVEFYDANNNLLDSDTSGPIADASTYIYPVFVYDVTAAGDYKVAATAGAVNFYGMAFVAEGTETTTVEATTVETTTEATTTEPTTVATTGPEAGKTYTANFASLTVADKLNGWTNGVISVVSSTNGAYVHDGTHGAALVNGDQINVAVAGNATVTLTLCQYGSGTEFAVTDSKGTALGTVAAKGATDGETVEFKYMGDATVLTFTLAATGEAYLHGVTSANDAAPIGEAKSFKVWLDDYAVDNVVKAGAYTGNEFGDSVLTLIGQGEEQFTQSYASAIGVTRDGKTVNGYKAGKRHATANDIPSVPQAGDGCAIVFTPAATGMLNTYFVSTSFLRVWDFDSTTGERYGYTDSDAAAESYGVKVEAGHTYVLSTTGKTNNMAFCGFEYVVDEPVSFGVSFNNVSAAESSIPNLEVSLTDAALGGEAAAVVKSTTSTVSVAKGHTYVLSTNDGGVKATVNGSDRFTATGDAVVIDLEDIPDQTLTGEITGLNNDTVTSLTFTNMLNGTVATATVDGTKYTATLKPGDYNTAIVTANNGKTYDRVKVVQGANNVNEVYVEYVDASKPMNYTPSTFDTVAYTGTVTPRTSDIVVAAGSQLTIPVAGAATVTVNAYYNASFTINGGEACVVDSGSTSKIDSFVVTTDANATSVVLDFPLDYGKSSYLTSISVAPVVAFKSEINVPGDYATLKDAVSAIKGMTDRPDGEAGRVTINLTADIQEQIVFDAPYITLNGNGHEINWYYGVGTYYYSIDPSTGLYSERLYRDKYSSAEGNGSLWGGVAIIRGNNFIAKDTTFRNTYNYEITDKELTDIYGTATGIPARTKDTDVTKYASKERSNAFYIEADNIEAYNCKILSSQDTLGRNGSANNGYHTYFKDCVIGGNVDYICGEFTAIFDNCELQWKSYANDNTNNAKIGYIVAPKTSPYIFRNCTVTTDGAAGDATVTGYYGRTWGASSNATFVNTETNGHILDSGWSEMSQGEGATSKFFEYNNTSNGAAFATNGEYSKALTDEATIKTMTSDDVISAYLNNWTPVYYAYAVNVKLWGDVNGDKVVDVKDVNATLEYTLGHNVSNFRTYLADVSGNGTIDSEDVALILQKVLAGDSFKFPVEKADPTPDESTEATTEATTEGTTEATTTEPTTASEPVNVYVVGDSTGCDYADTEDTSYFYKRVGFGTMLKDYFDDNTNIVNLALSGRSSKSFATGVNENGAADELAKANYATLKSSIKAGDYLIIAFGHNDEKTDAYRGTVPATTPGDYTQDGSFEKSLYDNYIKVALDAGATPILCTSTVRRQANVDATTKAILWGDNDIHITANGNYPAAVKALGEKLGIFVIDNLENTKSLYETLTPGVKATSKEVGATGAAALHAAGVEMSVDNTHLNKYGASYVASMMARDIKASTNAAVAKLAAHITSTEPPKADDAHTMSLNPNWTPFDESVYIPSSLWHTSGEWAGAVFGTGTGADALTEDSHPNHQINEITPGKEVQLVCDNNKGKIQGSSDGFVMYFNQIDADKDFELTATAVINRYVASKQTAFGLICRDNVFTGSSFGTATDWAGVGCFSQSVNQIDTAFTALARKSGALDKSYAVATTAPKTGDTVELKMTRTNGVYTVQYGNDAPQTIEGVDTNKSNAAKDFVGVTVTRNADVTFKNINLVVK